MAQSISFAAGMGRVFLSVFLISGSAWGGWYIYSYFWSVRSLDPKYEIVAIVQTSAGKEMLKTSFLAELLSLSIEHPRNLYQFDLEAAKKKLLAFPLIKEASLKRIPPGTLYIDYVVRSPVAFISDYTNTAIDDESHLIPFRPFFSPKKLPELFLGLQGNGDQWGDILRNESLSLALSFLKELEETNLSGKMHLMKIDVSKAAAPSLGNKYVQIILESDFQDLNDARSSFRITLLMPPENFLDGFKRFYALYKEKGSEWKRSMIIDLRIPRLGYIVFDT